MGNNYSTDRWIGWDAAHALHWQQESLADLPDLWEYPIRCGEQIQVHNIHCTCLPFSAAQIQMQLCIQWWMPVGYVPSSALWYHCESVGASHTMSQQRCYQFQCFLALCRQPNALWLPNSGIWASGSQAACQPYGHQVQCLPYVSNYKGWTRVTYSFTGHGNPPVEVSGLAAEISGVPECQTC